ncbi:MAG: VWA domain-containing protein [Candidatus Binatia bacterium]|nr:VWA domain-containing protein [Candidatus Binatia bacterium]
MDVSFLTPSAFTLLYALPLLVVPYLLRPQRRQIIVPALFLYQGISSSARFRLWGVPRLPPLFFLQLLILLLLVIAAAQPFIQQQGRQIAFVFDTSASMQARLPRTHESVLEVAKHRAVRVLEALPRGDRVSLFTTAPFPTLVASPSETAALLRSSLEGIRATDTPDPSDDMLTAFFARLLGEHGFARVFFFTDRPLAEPVATPALTVLSLGASQPNWGITAFRLYRSPFFPDTVDATVVLEGSSDMAEGSVGIEDGDTGRLLQSRPFASGTTHTVSFPDLPLAATYRARLFVDDALAVDNEAYAVLPRLTKVPVLVVSPAPELVNSLRQIPSLALEVVAPHAYEPARATRFAFVLFHLTAPDALPSTNAALILPPQGNALVSLGKSGTQVRVTQWTTAHPLTSYVTFSLLSPAYAEALQPPAWCKPVVIATVGPVVLACEREGRRYAAVGFDLLPYLGTQNLPTSILTLNLLRWLAHRPGEGESVKTGTLLALPHGTLRVRLPHGGEVSPSDERLAVTAQGVYVLQTNGEERRIAANLTNAAESHLGRPLHLAPLPAAAVDESATNGRPLWPWLLVTALLLLGVERWLAVRPTETVQAAR